MNNCLVMDWLAFSVPVDNDSDVPVLDQFFCIFPEVKDYMLNDSLFIKECSNRNYKSGASLGNLIFIYYDSTFKTNFGVNVQICSSGLETWFSLFGLDSSSAYPMLQLLQDRGCKVSRIDLCYDDFSKTFRPRDYALAWIEGRIQSRYRDFRVMGSGKDVGWTFYLGNRRTSKTLFRCYDKDIESGLELDSVRYEWEFHREKAVAVVDFILNNNIDCTHFIDSISFSGFLKGFMRVIKKSNNLRKDQVATDPKFSEFLVSVDNSLQNSHFANSCKSFEDIKETTIPVSKDLPSAQRKIEYFCNISYKMFLDIYEWLGSDVLFYLLEQHLATSTNHIYNVSMMKSINYTKEELVQKIRSYKS